MGGVATISLTVIHNWPLALLSNQGACQEQQASHWKDLVTRKGFGNIKRACRELRSNTVAPTPASNPTTTLGQTQGLNYMHYTVVAAVLAQTKVKHRQ